MQPEVRYSGRAGRAVLAVIMLILAGTLFVLPLLAPHQGAPGSAIPRAANFIVPAGICFAAAALRLFGLARGRPSLYVSAAGLKFQSLWSSRWANWDSLGPFEVMAADLLYIRRARVIAVAPVTGPNVSDGLRRKRRFVIQDVFRTPLATVVSDINGSHPQVFAARTAPAAEPSAVGAAALASAEFPWLTFVLLGVLVGIFIVQQRLAIEQPGPLLEPASSVLLALGGVNRSMLANGEYYRLFTAPLLHFNLAHLLGNCIALFIGGVVLERLVGRAWLLALFVIGGIGGCLMSVVLNPPGLTSVGASGAILALFAALIVASFRLPPGTARVRLRVRGAYMLIGSLLPLKAAVAGVRIDYAAHLGGALVGIAVAVLLLLRAWPVTQRRPSLQPLAVAVSVIGTVLSVGGMAAMAAHYPYRQVAMLIPAPQVPVIGTEIEQRGPELVAQYPRDPRAHLDDAWTMIHDRNYLAAERELRTALRLADETRPVFGESFDTRAHAALASVLLLEGHRPEAQEEADRACRSRAGWQLPPAMKTYLRRQHLCD